MSGQTRSLGSWLAETRQDLELSRAEAARRAGVSRQAWHAWETDASLPQDNNYAAIDRTMKWQRGSVRDLIATGRAPIALRDEPELDDERAAIVRETFQEWSKEYGRKTAQKMIDEVVAEWRDGGGGDMGERKSG